MSKYNKEFKQKAVDAYLAGEGGYKALAKKFEVPSHENIRKWVISFKQLEENSLINKKTRSSYPVKFKLDVLNYKLRTGNSYQKLTTDTTEFKYYVD